VGVVSGRGGREAKKENLIALDHGHETGGGVCRVGRKKSKTRKGKGKPRNDDLEKRGWGFMYLDPGTRIKKKKKKVTTKGNVVL